MTQPTIAPPDFARARVVHSTLYRLWAPTLKVSGFRRAGSSVCAFARPRADGCGFVTIGVQVSQWGASWSGNSFTLNAAGAAARPEDYPATVFRPLQWLTAEDCAAGLEIERRVRARFPMPAADHPVWSWAAEPGESGATFKRALDRLKHVHREMWMPGHDIWVPYHGIEDVTEWGHFLLPRLPTLIERAEAESSPRAGL